MNIQFYDMYGDHDVGEVVTPESSYSCRTDLIRDVENCRVELKPFSSSIGIYTNGSEGRVGWSLNCQDCFCVCDETGTIIFTSKGYNRLERSNSECQFYQKFKEFIDNGWSGSGPTVLLSDDDDFIV